MKNLGKKGQAEVMDGLILMLVSATCAVILLSVSSNYGILPAEIYQETYSKKLAQNTLLSLYHITYLDNEESPLYKKSIMVAVSSELSDGNTDLNGNIARSYIQGLLDKYHEKLGWEFMFALLPDGVTIDDDSVISSDEEVTSSDTYYERAGNPDCASAALTYPKEGNSCLVGGSAGNMCYSIFEICVWLS
jgi:hypothetical protein